MNRHGWIWAWLLFAAVAPAALAADEVTGVHLTLPEGIDWIAATDKSDGSQSLREWLPKGASFDSTDWMVVEQKLRLKAGQTARAFLDGVYERAKGACTSVKFTDPVNFGEGGGNSVVGHFACAQVKGQSYGTDTDQRVIVGGALVFVITSELRHPATAVAGVESFKPDQAAAMVTLLQRRRASGTLVRSAVEVCTNGRTC